MILTPAQHIYCRKFAIRWRLLNRAAVPAHINDIIETGLNRPGTEVLVAYVNQGAAQVEGGQTDHNDHIGWCVFFRGDKFETCVYIEHPSRLHLLAELRNERQENEQQAMRFLAQIFRLVDQVEKSTDDDDDPPKVA